MGWKGWLSGLITGGAIITHAHYTHLKPEIPDVPPFSEVALKKSVRPYGDVSIPYRHFGHEETVKTLEERLFEVADFRDANHAIVKSKAWPVHLESGRYGELDIRTMEFVPWEYREYYEQHQAFDWMHNTWMWTLPILLSAGLFMYGDRKREDKDNSIMAEYELSPGLKTIGALLDPFLNHPYLTGSISGAIQAYGLSTFEYTSAGAQHALLYGSLVTLEHAALWGTLFAGFSFAKKDRATNILRAVVSGYKGSIDPGVFAKESIPMHMSIATKALEDDRLSDAAHSLAQTLEYDEPVHPSNGYLNFIGLFMKPFSDFITQLEMKFRDPTLAERLSMQLNYLRHGNLKKLKEYTIESTAEADSAAIYGLQAVILEKAGVQGVADEFKAVTIRKALKEGIPLSRIGESRREKLLIDDVFLGKQGVLTKYDTLEEAEAAIERATHRYNGIRSLGTFEDIATPRMFDTVFENEGFYTYETYLQGKVLADCLLEDLEPTIMSFGTFLGRIHGNSSHGIFDFGKEINVNHYEKIDKRLTLLDFEDEETVRVGLHDLLDDLQIFPLVNNFDSHIHNYILDLASRHPWSMFDEETWDQRVLHVMDIANFWLTLPLVHGDSGVVALENIDYFMAGYLSQFSTRHFTKEMYVDGLLKANVCRAVELAGAWSAPDRNMLEERKWLYKVADKSLCMLEDRCGDMNKYSALRKSFTDAAQLSTQRNHLCLIEH